MTTQKQRRERLTLAKTVLSELEEEWIIATQGQYLTVEGADFEDLVSRGSKAKVQTVLSDKQCKACAIGSIFVAAVDTFDSLRVGDLRYNYNQPNDDDMIEYLGRWFSESELRIIEVAFEGNTDQWENGFEGELADDATAALIFHEAIEERACEEEERTGKTPSIGTMLLTAIMENIVKNKGVFVPE
jgi:hypothetical protein